MIQSNIKFQLLGIVCLWCMLGQPAMGNDLEPDDVRVLKRFLYEMGPRPGSDVVLRVVERGKAGDADAEALFWGAECIANHWTKDADFVELARRASAKKYPPAMALYGFALCTGEGGVVKDASKGVELIRSAAVAGDALGLHYLSWAYLMGWQGAPRNLEKADSIAQQSLEKGMTRNLGLLAKIADQSHNPKKSIYELRAAEAGDTEMMMYLYDDQLKQGKKEQAEFWLRRGALFGNHKMMRTYAVAMEQGTGGLERDSTLSRMLLEKAANEGDEDSRANLAYGQIVGIYGYTADAKSGMELMRKLAERDVAIAQYYLGMFQITGKVVDKDDASGRAWLKKAAANGSEEAIKAMKTANDLKNDPQK